MRDSQLSISLFGWVLGIWCGSNSFKLQARVDTRTPPVDATRITTYTSTEYPYFLLRTPYTTSILPATRLQLLVSVHGDTSQWYATGFPAQKESKSAVAGRVPFSLGSKAPKYCRLCGTAAGRCCTVHTYRRLSAREAWLAGSYCLESPALGLLCMHSPACFFLRRQDLEEQRMTCAGSTKLVCLMPGDPACAARISRST